MNKSVIGLVSAHLKKRGICSSPFLARIFLLSLCFSSTLSFFLSVSSIFPSSRSLRTPTQQTWNTGGLEKKKHYMDLLCFEHNRNIQSIYVALSDHSGSSVCLFIIDSPLVGAQACICRGQQGPKVRGQLIHLYRKAREAIVKNVVLGLWICK